MATKRVRRSFVTRLREYIKLSTSKFVVWGLFLAPYVAIMIFYSGALPRTVQLAIYTVIYNSTISLQTILPTPNPYLRTEQAVPDNVDFDQLTIGYFLSTYLWSCILVESFGTIYPRTRKRTK